MIVGSVERCSRVVWEISSILRKSVLNSDELPQMYDGAWQTAFFFKSSGVQWGTVRHTRTFLPDHIHKSYGILSGSPIGEGWLDDGGWSIGAYTVAGA